MKFVPSAWRSEPTLANCSLAARGLWIELMCVAHDNAGLVLVAGRSPSVEEIARQVRSGTDEVRNLLDELQRNGVCSIRADGTVYSRRMVRETKKRKTNRKNGSLGGNPALKRKTDNQSDNREDNQNPNIRSDQHLTSNSNLSTSRSVSRTRSPKDLGLHADAFAAFWKAYPRKTKKQNAIAAWIALNPSEEQQAEIFSALAWQVNQPGWHEQRGKFVPYPASWLNDCRWTDEPFHPSTDYQPDSHTKTGRTMQAAQRVADRLKTLTP